MSKKDTFTAKVIELKGNPKNPESAQHIIIFPGGSIEISRTTDGEYWVHVEVNRDTDNTDSLRGSRVGQVVDSRIDYDFPKETVDMPDIEKIKHLAIRIKTS